MIGNITYRILDTLKVNIITRHSIINYGSLLQAFALQEVIKRMGHSCEIIDYIREDETYQNIEKSILKRKNKWNSNIFKNILYLLIRQPESIIAGRKFAKMRKKYLFLTRNYSSVGQLLKNRPEADIYVTGSDQVWGPVVDGTYDDSYFLSFVNGKKVSYAASFGRTEVKDELLNLCKGLLSSYEKITVREKSAVKILKDMGIESELVLDPVLLLSSFFWDKYTEPIIEKDYILIYQLHNDKTLGEYAKKVAEAKGLSLIRVSAYYHQILREGKLKYCPSLGKFLGYIKNAKCLITDSFHGTAFAIIFNIPFIEILPKNSTGTRNMNILELTGLTDRILTNVDNTKLIDEKIDYTDVNRILLEYRKSSTKKLRIMLT